MKCLVRDVGAVPEVGAVAEPSGETIEVLAAPVNPIDLAVSRGALATGHPPLPYVPGCEAVGRTADGGSSGSSADRSGALRAARWRSVHRWETHTRSRCRTAPIRRSPLHSGSRASPAGCPSRGARRCGAARTSSCWAPPARSASSPCRRPSCSVQVASSRRVGVPRASSAPSSTARTRRFGSTRATTSSPCSRTSSAATGPSYVFDPLWGAPAAAAVEAAVPRATIVNLGQSAGATSELSSAAVRFKSLSILGHTNFAVPAASSRASTGGSSSTPSPATSMLDVDRVGLDSVADAWRRQADGAGTKLVLIP